MNETAFLSPYVAMRTLSAALSGTDFAHHRHFTDYAETWRQGFVDSLNKAFADKAGAQGWSYRAGPELWKNAPAFAYQPPKPSYGLDVHRPSALALLVWLLVAFGLGAHWGVVVQGRGARFSGLRGSCGEIKPLGILLLFAARRRSRHRRRRQADACAGLRAPAASRFVFKGISGAQAPEATQPLTGPTSRSDLDGERSHDRCPAASSLGADRRGAARPGASGCSPYDGGSLELRA